MIIRLMNRRIPAPASPVQLTDKNRHLMAFPIRLRLHGFAGSTQYFMNQYGICTSSDVLAYLKKYYDILEEISFIYNGNQDTFYCDVYVDALCLGDVKYCIKCAQFIRNDGGKSQADHFISDRHKS